MWRYVGFCSDARRQRIAYVFYTRVLLSLIREFLIHEYFYVDDDTQLSL